MLKTIPRVAIPIGSKEIAAVMTRLVAGEDESGEDVTKFESELGAYLGVQNIFACNSGRTALHVALQALELKPGEEVVVPAYTCAIVFEVILRLGLKPKFVDVNPETYNIYPQLIPKCITSKTRAIIPIHLFGRPCEMNLIMETAEKHGLYVIEDVAQALGAEYERRKVGTFGDLAIFSFGIGKGMTSGEGGAVAVKNKELIERIAPAQIRLSKASLAWRFRVSKKILAMKVFSNFLLFSFIRNYLEESLNENEQDVLENCLSLNDHRNEFALNSTITLAKMPSLSAKIAREQLKKLDTFNEKRMMFAATLNELLNGLHDYVELPETSSSIKNTFTRYPVKLLKGSREKLMKRLVRQGIDTGRPYHYLANFFESLHLNMPNTLMLAERTVTIPNHVLLKASDIFKIADVVKRELKANVYSE
jgi:dTDP-4-amino-4,6-dideoxygalactose transaminase